MGLPLSLASTSIARLDNYCATRLLSPTSTWIACFQHVVWQDLVCLVLDLVGPNLQHPCVARFNKQKPPRVRARSTPVIARRVRDSIVQDPEIARNPALQATSATNGLYEKLQPVIAPWIVDQCEEALKRHRDHWEASTVSFVESQRDTSEEVLRRLENSQHLQATQPDEEDDAPLSMQAAPAHGRNNCHCCAGSTEGGLLTTLTSTIGSDLRATDFVLSSQAAPLPTSSHLVVPTAGPLPLPRVKSWSIPETCPWQIPWPLPDTPIPVIDNVDSPQFNLFPRPNVSSYKMTVYNFCSYDLWPEPHVGSRVENVEHVAPNGVYSRSFQAADEKVGISLKVSKIEGNFERPVQIEYSGGKSTIAYDLSLINCLGQTGEIRYGKVVRNGNLSACAGHGLQLGNTQSRSFQCGAGAWCDDQAYLYEASQQE